MLQVKEQRNAQDEIHHQIPDEPQVTGLRRVMRVLPAEDLIERGRDWGDAQKGDEQGWHQAHQPGLQQLPNGAILQQVSCGDPGNEKENRNSPGVEQFSEEPGIFESVRKTDELDEWGEGLVRAEDVVANEQEQGNRTERIDLVPSR